MKEWNRDKLEAEGYKIENAYITHVDLSMADHGVLTLEISLEGNSWGCVYGGYVLGQGYLGAKEFKGSEQGLESIMRIMDVVGVDKFNKMAGTLIRVATKGWGSSVKIIGNAIKDQWFDINTFFEDYISAKNEKIDDVLKE